MRAICPSVDHRHCVAHFSPPCNRCKGKMQNLQSACGIFALLAIAWIVSEDRRGVAWRQAAAALVVTFATAVILLKVTAVPRAFAAINNAIRAFAHADRARASLVFG